MKNLRKFKVFNITGRTIKLFILFALVLAISSCATVRSTSISRDEIPSLSENRSRIYFYRKSLVFGSGTRPPIFLNGKTVGISSSGTAFYVDVDPGKYEVSVARVLYSGSEGRVDFEVHENEVVYVRTWAGGSSFTGRTNVGVVSPETAEKEIKDLKFLRFNLGFEGHSHNYIPNSSTFKLDGITEFSSKNTISLVNSQTSSDDVLFAMNLGHIFFCNLQSWTDTAIDITQRELTNRDMNVVKDAPKSLKLSIETVKVTNYFAFFRCKTTLKVETGEGYVKTYLGDNSSPATLTRAADGAVMRAVAEMLRDDEIIAYFKK